MENLNKDIGKRLRQVREIMNEGSKLSAEQFAYLLGETRDKIANYESGRAALPVRILYELFNRGISVEFILTGNGSIFAENEAGKLFESKISNLSEKRKKHSIDDVKVVKLKNNVRFDTKNINIENVAAGKIEG